MIGSFKDGKTRRVFDGDRPKGFDIKLLSRARRKLEQLNAAERIEDLYFPPSNRLHALEGFSPTRYAISVNDKWRITFEWTNDRADDVCLEDYH